MNYLKIALLSIGLLSCSTLKKNSEGELLSNDDGKWKVDIRGWALKIGNPYVRVLPLDPAWKETRFESASREERVVYLKTLAKLTAEKDCEKRSMTALFPSEPVEVDHSSALTFQRKQPYGLDLAYSCEGKVKETEKEKK